MQFQEYLKENNIKQEEAAKQLGVCQGVCSLWATGKRIPRPDRMAKITEWSGGEVTANDFYAKEE